MNIQAEQYYLVLQRVSGGVAEWALILLPLMLYLGVLALSVNSQRHPVIVRGPWNMLGLLLGVSGIFLLGPPSWATHSFQRWGTNAYGLAYCVYVLILLGIAIWLIRRQRDIWVIYNIESAIFAEVMQEVLASLSTPYTATPGRIAFAEGELVLDIDVTFLLNNVTLRWHGADQPIRQEVERKLIVALGEVQSGYNPARPILLLAVGMLFVFIVLSLSLYYALNY